MRKLMVLLLILIAVFTFSGLNGDYEVCAENENNVIYTIYKPNGDYLFERANVKIGDEYIEKHLNSYEVYEIDEETKTGKAIFVKSYKKPSISIKESGSGYMGSNRGKVALYMTHNDESYVSGDGIDSIYDAGGIHDVAKKLRSELQSRNIEVVLDESLHIPHDTLAYSRSNITAKELLKNNPSGIFDIHRDGTSRSFYVTNVAGEERCMVRIVIGKSNPNMSKNKEFALYLMSIADELYPWLFVDLYIGNGHYNQALKDNALLFEMGSHLVEKDLVMKTVPALASILDIALFGEVEVNEPSIEQAEPNDTKNEVVEDIQTPLTPVVPEINDGGTLENTSPEDSFIDKEGLAVIGGDAQNASGFEISTIITVAIIFVGFVGFCMYRMLKPKEKNEK